MHGAKSFRIVGSLVVLSIVSVAIAQVPPSVPTALVIYPAKGQSATQQQNDKTQCDTWATQQTGFDPVQALEQLQAREAAEAQSAPPPPPAGQGILGAAGGAAGGAAIGAIAGNAGKGAAIGAMTGFLFGRAERRRQAAQQRQAQEQAEQNAQQQDTGTSQQLANYNRYVAACMTGRGYSVIS